MVEVVAILSDPELRDVIATVSLTILALSLVWALAAFSESEFTREHGPYDFRSLPPSATGLLIAGRQTLPAAIDGARPIVSLHHVTVDEKGRLKKQRLWRQQMRVQLRQRRLPSTRDAGDEYLDVLQLPGPVADRLELVRAELQERLQADAEGQLGVYVSFKFGTDPYYILFRHPDVSLRGAALVTLLSCLFSIVQGLLLR